MTVLQNINTTTTTGFNKNKGILEKIMAIALDMSKAFDAVHLHKLLHKITQTNMSNTGIKFVLNYIRRCKKLTLYTTQYQNKQQ